MIRIDGSRSGTASSTWQKRISCKPELPWRALANRSIHDVSGSLVRDAVICYARPFNKCKGEKNTYELKVRWIPSEWRDLHREFMGVRKGFIAHTDLTVIEPRAARWHVADREALTPLVSGL